MRPLQRDAGNPQFLFRLVVRLPGGTAVIRAWEGSYTDRRLSTHTKIETELRWLEPGKRSEVVFAPGDTWCGIPGHQTTDGIYAREAVCSLLAMKPGDTDSDYFASYTPEQLAWAEAHGEDLRLASDARYCDENGNPRRGAR